MSFTLYPKSICITMKNQSTTFQSSKTPKFTYKTFFVRVYFTSWHVWVKERKFSWIYLRYKYIKVNIGFLHIFSWWISLYSVHHTYLFYIQLKLSQVNFVQKLVFTVDFIKFERSTVKFHLSIRHHRVSIQFSTKLITFFTGGLKLNPFTFIRLWMSREKM